MRNPFNAKDLTMATDRADLASVVGMIALRLAKPQRPRIYARSRLAQKSLGLRRMHALVDPRDLHSHQIRLCVARSAKHWCSERLSCRPLGRCRTM